MEDWEVKEALVAASKKIKEQAEFINQLTSPPLSLGTVLVPSVDLGAGNLPGLILASGGGPLVVNQPAFPVETGDVVSVNGESKQIVNRLAAYEPQGELTTVLAINGAEVEVDGGGGRRTVLAGKFPTVEKGDRVILDPSGSVVIRSLGKEAEQFSFKKTTGIRWSDIGGLTEAKKAMQEAIEGPFRNADLYKLYGRRPLSGVLLYGPPGCGKTMFGKAAATALAELHGATDSDGFLYIKGPEVLEKYVGVAEANIRNLFERTRKHKAQYGYPAVVFIDEADAILGKRGTGISSDVNNTIVPAFLTEMDGLDESGALIILATNRADVLDPAVTRDGRIDRKIRITRPDQDSAEDIFSLYLQGKPLRKDLTASYLSTVAALALYDDRRALYEISLKSGNELQLTLGQIVNGGMIAGIVNQACELAMDRDRAAGGKPKGIEGSDLVAAVERVYAENLDLNHSDDLADLVGPFRSDVKDIRRLASVSA